MFTHNLNRKLYQQLTSGIIILLLCSCATVTSNIPSASVKVALVNPSTPAPITQSINNATPSSPSQATATKTPMPSAQAGSSATKAVNSTQAAGNGKIKTVFLIVMENHNWSDILNNQSAPYINGTLLPQASYAQQYFNPNGNHPSEPNYLWLEAGTSFGITKDGTPAKDSQKTTDHLVTYLDKAGVSWKSYQEGITGSTCPLKGSGLYAPKHNPMVFFTDVTGNNDPNSKYCIAHVRPFSELQTDMTNNTVAQYNFITPNLCDDMHNSDGCQTRDSVKNGDAWLSVQVPLIMSSKAYNDGGVIFITWDESENGKHPIGMIVLSPFAKGGGYTNSIHYTHSSTLRSVEEIFGVTPLLGDAANATDLRDLFKVFP